MAPLKNIIIGSGLLLCVSGLVHAQTTQAAPEQTSAATTTQTQTATGQTATTTATGQPATIATGQPTQATGAQTMTAPTGQVPGMPPGTMAPTGVAPGTVVPAAPGTVIPAAPGAEPVAPGAVVPAAPGTAIPAAPGTAPVAPGAVIPAAPGTVPVAPGTPGTTAADGTYVPRTQYDNTPSRFNMTQDGKRMSANDFDAWMRAKGYRVAKGRPPGDCPNALPAGVQTIVGPDGCPVEVSIDLEGVTFQFAKTVLRPEAKKTLDQAVEILERHPELTVEVAGHTDAKGAPEFNQKLSEQRAKAVYDYLVGQGIPKARLVGPIGYGESKPIATNETEAGREQNRRTELNVKAAAAPAMAATPPAKAVPGVVGADGQITFEVPVAAAAPTPQPSPAATAPATVAAPATPTAPVTAPAAQPQAAPVAATAEPEITFEVPATEVPATVPAARPVAGWVPRVATGKPAPAPTADQAAAARTSAASVAQPSAPPAQDEAKPEDDQTPR